MIDVACKACETSSVNDLETELKRIWLEELMYQSGFEKHQLEKEADGGIFHFVTGTQGLGVVGRIEFRYKWLTDENETS